MQNEATVVPLVDILSKQLGEQVVMSGDKFVYHAGFLPVEQSLVEVALLEQDRLYQIALNDLKPNTVTMRQARLALLQSGKLQTVTDAIANGTDEALKIEWEYATDVKRDWASLITLTEALGMTSAELDSLFLLASTL